MGRFINGERPRSSPRLNLVRPARFDADHKELVNGGKNAVVSKEGEDDRKLNKKISSSKTQPIRRSARKTVCMKDSNVPSGMVTRSHHNQNCQKQQDCASQSSHKNEADDFCNFDDQELIAGRLRKMRRALVVKHDMCCLTLRCSVLQVDNSRRTATEKHETHLTARNDKKDVHAEDQREGKPQTEEKSARALRSSRRSLQSDSPRKRINGMNEPVQELEKPKMVLRSQSKPR